MTKNRLLFVAIPVVVAFILGLLFGRQFLAPAGGGGSSLADSAEAGESAEAEPQLWTCSMHPQILQPGPGDCPICAMDLIPLEKDAGADSGPRQMSMSASARALAEIETSPVHRGFPEVEVRLVGKLEYDETRVKSLTARFPARLDKLFVNFTGIPVKRGEHLAEVYSPTLLTTQRELLAAHERDPSGAIVRSAREKLRLWDLLPEQIDAIIAAGEASDRFVLRAPIGGIVVERNVREGDYVETGESLFRIVDLSELWLYLAAYESDLAWLHYGQDVAFSVESFPGETFHGRVSFIEPEVDRMTRTVRVRVNVPNPDSLLKPGMFARGIIKAKMAAGGAVFAPELAGKWISPMHPEIIRDGPGPCDVCGMDLVPAEDLGYVKDPGREAPLLVPASAVLQTGKRAVVYVELSGSERPTFEGREIVLGPRAGDAYIVAEGLEEGDRVVTKGAFKIDSALQIQARPSMMAGAEPVADINGPGVVEVAIPTDVAAGIMGMYLKMATAMAQDDLDGTRQQLMAMMEVTGHSGPLPDLIHSMLAAEDMEGIRRPHFESLSNAMIAAVRADPSAFTRKLHLMHCSMVYEDRGADWIQADDKLLNPYWGSVMLRCGEVKGKLN
jgi:Cu(I)/Ag(I) efflux system membrane fusion protein